MAYHDPEMNQHQFVGPGFYFWENNIEMANVWGKLRYNDQYYILEVLFELTEENCFDLVGNRNHQLYMVDCLKQLFIKSGVQRDYWTINQCIHFLRKLNELNKKIFPFQYVRVIDLYKHATIKKQYSLKFLKHRQNYTVINPRIIVCAFNKDDINLLNKRIVFSSPIVSL